jgi:regulatory protein
MRITSISAQAKNPNRVNISVDGKYRFSLDVFQLVDLGIKIGKEYTEEELVLLETESQFGKLYGRALEYCLLRPHSAKEVKDYLWRKTRTVKKLQKPSERMKAKGNFESKIVEIAGVPQDVADRVFKRLVEKDYINDEKFARYWVENRNQAKGTSRRKLAAELQAKGVERTVIEQALEGTARNDSDELQKIINKKRGKYPDEQKLLQYLARQGFSYDDIKYALTNDE